MELDEQFEQAIAQEDEEVERLAQAVQDFSLFIPFTRAEEIDGRREIVGIATSESVDAHGTIFSFEASKKAFARWQGNIREMHDDKRAIGRAIEWQPDEDRKQIILRCFISKSADGDNAWTKIQEGILKGFSIGGRGKSTPVQRGSQMVPVFQDYELHEVSLVDTPSCPDAILLARADGFVDQIVEETMEEEQTTPEQQPETETQDIERVGARISAETQQQLHGLRDSNLTSSKQAAQACGCDYCQVLLNKLDPDCDGDIDVVNSLDYDGDAGMPTTDEEAMPDYSAAVERAVTTLLPQIEEMVKTAITRAAETDFTRNKELVTAELETVTRSLTDIANTVKEQSTLISTIADVRSELSGVQEDVQRIKKMPLPGGPVLNGSAPVDKKLVTQPEVLDAYDSRAQTDPEYIRRLFNANLITPGDYRNRMMQLSIFKANT